MAAAVWSARKPLEVTLNSGGTRLIAGNEIVVNVGSHAAIPDSPVLKEARALVISRRRSHGFLKVPGNLRPCGSRTRSDAKQRLRCVGLQSAEGQLTCNRALATLFLLHTVDGQPKCRRAELDRPARLLSVGVGRRGNDGQGIAPLHDKQRFCAVDRHR